MMQRTITLALIGFATLWIAFQGVGSVLKYYQSIGVERFPAQIIEVDLDERVVLLSDSRRLPWGRDLDIPLKPDLKGETVMLVAETGFFGNTILRSAKFPTRQVASRN